jgi:hypothetical protein
MHAQGLRPRRARDRHERSPTPVWPSAYRKDVGTLEDKQISGLDTWPTCAPVNASPAPSRLLAHDSGSGWIASPSLSGSFILDSKPV